MKFWVLKPNYRGLVAKPPVAGGNRRSGGGASVFGNFCSVLINILHFKTNLSLNFY